MHLPFRRAVVVVALGVLLAGCAGSPAAPAAAPAPAGGDPSGRTQSAAPAPAARPVPQREAGTPRVLASGLEVPWGVSFLPDGNALVTERETARILRVAPGGQVTPVGTVAGVVARGEGGLLGIAVSPRFATDRTVAVYYTSGSDNRVVALRVAADGTVDGAAQRVLVAGINAGSVHNGGGLAFGPGGMLHIGTGEAGRRSPSQDRDDLGGKILRVTPDGAPAPGNPFGTPVLSLGHRNVQGIAFGPGGRVYAAEFGQNTVDELNLITPGANYGWPDVEGIGDRPDLTNPLLTWPTDEASPSGMAAAGGALWMSALRGERLWQIPLTADGAPGEPRALLDGRFGRIRAVTATPDGSALWVTTSNRDGRGSPGPDDDRIVVVPLT
ncbi:sorbosone dehydrogenase family protein [Pseudonocardia sp. KRD291]|uniref:PQQ-dependent sugar dehydrogenase n=1 Tax=Pseudonocardia sp. KRD291 TaxID=2792007 RepID=UPI001C4A6E22|nr:PQQ-dependent sugar dehydrogenase [Pseudonocardia sp. KRD291]MBW0103778.1 PQQ-dependent sugar dehydrogenase [Pseudonocardia sp. KRD291]